MSNEENAIISRHESNGNYVMVDGLKTFYLDAGMGPVVFCIHGVPTSSFLYRKVVQQLQQKGLRAIAIDLPGLGLTDRPENFNYIFSNFGTFCNRFLDSLKIDEVHLLIHDIGAPVGLSMAAQNSNRIKSITVLNSMLDVEHFVKPLPMRPFEMPVLGEAELAMLTPTTFPLMMKGAGVVDMDVISQEEMAAYIHLLKKEDGGKAFLKIMRSFEKTKEFTEACYRTWKNPAYPVQLIWGDKDPFLTWKEKGREFEEARPGVPITKVESKHFLQEEAYETIAAKVKEIIVSS
jgi:pimeloyl-ACP methyl ester carboxylesterase